MLKMIVAAAFLATTITGVAQAEDGARQVRVSYADLDLRRPADVKRLDQRLHRAVNAVCPAGETTDRFAFGLCRKAALARLADQRAAALAAAHGATQLASIAH